MYKNIDIVPAYKVNNMLNKVLIIIYELIIKNVFLFEYAI